MTTAATLTDDDGGGSLSAAAERYGGSEESPESSLPAPPTSTVPLRPTFSTHSPFELHRLCASAGPSSEAVRSFQKSDPASLTRSDDLNRMTPLHHACASGASVKFVRVLHDAVRGCALGGGGVEVALEAKDRHGRMPLHCACQYGKAPFEVIELLAESCPTALGMVDKLSCTPLHYACCRSNSMLSAVRLLVRLHPDALYARGLMGGTRGMTPLHVLCRYGGSPNLVGFLARTRPEVTGWRDGDGQTPLGHALGRWANIRTVRALLDADNGSALSSSVLMTSTAASGNAASGGSGGGGGVAVRQRDVLGRTPLHIACGGGGPAENALVLLERWPEAVHDHDREGRTPLEMAPPALRGLLVRYGAYLRGEMDGNLTAMKEFFDVCRHRGSGWAEGARLLVRRDPSLAHLIDDGGIVEASLLLPDLLTRVAPEEEGCCHGGGSLDFVWRTLRSAPGSWGVGI